MGFQRAERKRASLKIAVTGPSGSGKTYSSLLMAFGLGSKVAVLDTENGSASLYADLGEYDTLEIAPPFTTQKYIDGIKMAEGAGYEVLVIDSLTHAWAAEGGILDQKTAKDVRGGNQYTNWKEPGDAHNKFVNTILQSPLHIIATMRSKVEYMLEGNKPVKKGMAAIQREGLEYEFTAVFDVDMGHNALVSKDRTRLFGGEVIRIDRKTGERIKAWHLAAPEIPVSEGEVLSERMADAAQMLRLGKALENMGELPPAGIVSYAEYLETMTRLKERAAQIAGGHK